MNEVEKNPAIGRSWEEVRTELFTPEEIAESDIRVAIIGEMIRARAKLGEKQVAFSGISGKGDFTN